MGMFSGEVFLVFLGVAAFTAGVYVVREECPGNEEYLICGSACPFNCTDPEGPVTCAEECVEGCFCKSGYLRDNNGTCVSAEQCIGGSTGKSPVCGPNEEFLACGTACPATCSRPDAPLCGLACSMGCFCKAGYYREATNNTCVTLDQCPIEPCLNQNEVYDICNKSCEPSCEDPEPICTKDCTGGCVCSPGLLRDIEGSCVTVDKCPGGNTTEPGQLGKYLNAINKILHLTAAQA